MSNGPSELEIKNAQKVVGFLSDMEGISFKSLREDIFEVEAVGGGSCLIDVEESIVCLQVEICDVPEVNVAELDSFFMEQNGKAVHGKFAKIGGKYFFKDNLEFANLDFNELEASLKWCFGMVTNNVQKVVSIMKTGVIGAEIDLDSDEIDLEDLVDAGEDIADLMVTGAVLATELFSGEREEVFEDERVEVREETVEHTPEPQSYTPPSDSLNTDTLSSESSFSSSSDDFGGGGMDD